MDALRTELDEEREELDHEAGWLAMELVHETDREKLALQQHSSTCAGSRARLYVHGGGLTYLLSFLPKKTPN
jgi:hypothetical protein